MKLILKTINQWLTLGLNIKLIKHKIWVAVFGNLYLAPLFVWLKLIRPPYECSLYISRYTHKHCKCVDKIPFSSFSLDFKGATFISCNTRGRLVTIPDPRGRKSRPTRPSSTELFPQLCQRSGSNSESFTVLIYIVLQCARQKTQLFFPPYLGSNYDNLGQLYCLCTDCEKNFL